jgi:hypothetical protein
MELKDIIKWKKQVYDIINSSDSFNYSVKVNYAKRGTACDSSTNQDNVSMYIEQSLKEYIDDNMEHILNRANAILLKEFLDCGLDIKPTKGE